MTWKSVKRFVVRAEEILKEHNSPHTYKEIMSRNYQPEDRYISAAVLIITNYKHLLDEVDRNRTERALDRLYIIRDCGNDLWLYDTLPDTPKVKGAQETKNTAHITDVINGYLVAGHRLSSRNYDKGGKNRLPRELWQATAKELYSHTEYKRKKGKLAEAVFKFLYPKGHEKYSIKQVERVIIIKNL